MKHINTHILSILAIACAMATSGLTARTSTGQLEDPRVVISEIQEQSLAREKEIAKTLEEGGVFMEANRDTSNVVRALVDNDLEAAAKGIIDGREKQYSEFYTKHATFFEGQVEAASADSSRAIRHLGQRPIVDDKNRIDSTKQFAEGGAASTSEDAARLRERMEGLNADANAYAESILALLPELGPELANEWDPDQLVETAINAQMDSLQYAYYARISRINALLWEKFPNIIKRRALEGATGGRPKSTDEVIRRGESMKIQLGK